MRHQVFDEILVLIARDFAQVELWLVVFFLRDDSAQTFVDRFIDTARRDIMFAIVFFLNLAATARFVDRQAHAIGHIVAVHDHLAIDVARSPADRLN